jgi:hypothetical protein
MSTLDSGSKLQQIFETAKLLKFNFLASVRLVQISPVGNSNRKKKKQAGKIDLIFVK